MKGGVGVATFPLSHRRSSVNDGLTATVVVAARWSGFRVTLKLELSGKMRSSSRLPQYFITAMLLGARPVT